MSLRKILDVFIAIPDLFIRRAIVLALFVLAVFPACAQYPGQVSKSTKEAPVLRSIGVLEWTGPEENPKSSRLVPVLVYDNGKLEDGGIYLARPEPMAVAPEVEYELQEHGKAVGLYDVQTAGQQFGSWVGFGAWKSMPTAPRNQPKPTLPEWGMDNQEGDRPVLHRKRHADEAPSGGSSGGASGGQGSGGQAPTAPSDPDRPVLHKSKSAGSDDSSASASSTGSSSSGTSPSGTSTSDSSSPGSVVDSDRPVLHKKDSETDSSASSAPSDPDRPVLHKSKKAQPSDLGNVSSISGGEDPDRPRLKRGMANMDSLKVLPSLVGLPPDLEQSVAVSDSRNRPEHPFIYTWSDPAVEAKMKSSLEDIARDALGLNPAPPPAPKAKTAGAQKTTTTAHRTTKPAAAPTPAEPAPLLEEHFRALELTYGAEATLVFTAHTDAPPEQQKFVTLVAQPDFYGNVHVVLKSVTDAAHLDDKPRLRFVDAVDALGDNRAELLFEMRGATERQFALFRIARGQAEKLFETGGGQFGADPNN